MTDYADEGVGTTRDSVAFHRDHRHHLGDLARVAVRFPGFDDPHDPFLMVLTDTRGDRLLLSGCTTGYVGEGPHATLQLLVAEGVPVELAMAVTDAARLTLARDSDGSWLIEDNIPGHDRDRDDAVHEHNREHTTGRRR